MTDQQPTIDPKPEPVHDCPNPVVVQPQQHAQGLQAMSGKDVNAYMTSLIETQPPPSAMTRLELEALTHYREIAQQQGNAERRLTRAQNEVTALKSQISRMQGQSEAYVNLLVLAEDQRRADAKAKAN